MKAAQRQSIIKTFQSLQVSKIAFF